MPLINLENLSPTFEEDKDELEKIEKIKINTNNSENEILKTNKIEIHSSFVGEYVTSLEMNGASITLLKLDEELQPLLENPAHCSMFSV